MRIRDGGCSCRWLLLFAIASHTLDSCHCFQKLTSSPWTASSTQRLPSSARAAVVPSGLATEIRSQRCRIKACNPAPPTLTAHPFPTATPTPTTCGVCSQVTIPELTSSCSTGSSIGDSLDQSGLWSAMTRKWASLRRFARIFRKRLIRVAMSLVLIWSLHLGMSAAAAATSGYRTGGSFKSSSSSSGPRYSSPSSSRPRYSSSRPYQQRRPSSSTRIRVTTPSQPIQIVGAYPSLSPWVSFYRMGSTGGITYVRTTEQRASTTFSRGDALLLTGTGALLTYGFMKTSQRNHPWDDDDYSQTMTTTGPLGPGATSISVTVSINVPDRNDPNNILNRLGSLAERVDTSTRAGVQELIAETSIELLRNEALITSMLLTSRHHSDAEKARKFFNDQSVENRSKYEREAVDSFGGRSVSRTGSSSSDSSSVTGRTSATVAVVNLNLAIDGDSTHFPNVKSRTKLIEALRRIASDARVEDCLFAAEVIWIPGDRDDSLSREEVFERYPSLLFV